MTCDAQRGIFGTCFTEHVEEVQATQGVGCFGAVEQSFEHGTLITLRRLEILQSLYLKTLTSLF
jgi:hypothetical protein